MLTSDTASAVTHGGWPLFLPTRTLQTPPGCLLLRSSPCGQRAVAVVRLWSPTAHLLVRARESNKGIAQFLGQTVPIPVTHAHIASRATQPSRSCALRLPCHRSGARVLTASGAIVRARLQRIAWQLQPTSTSMLRGWRPERPSSNATVLFLLAPGCGGRWAPSCLRSC